MKVFKILIADGQSLTVAGISYLIEGLSGFTVVGKVDNWQALTNTFQREVPDVLIFDYIHLEGFSHERYQQFTQQYPLVKFFAITADQNHQQVLPILQANTSAFLTKDCSEEEIVTALQAVISGQKFYCESVLQLLMNRSMSQNSMSPREIQIIQYISQELSTQEIADQLHLSPHTINAHRKRILKKLEAKTPIGLVLQALRHQLISL